VYGLNELNEKEIEIENTILHTLGYLNRGFTLTCSKNEFPVEKLK